MPEFVQIYVPLHTESHFIINIITNSTNDYDKLQGIGSGEHP